MGIAAILMLAALGWPIIEKPILRRFPLGGWRGGGSRIRLCKAVAGNRHRRRGDLARHAPRPHGLFNRIPAFHAIRSERPHSRHPGCPAL
jgi:peptidoglycan/LPS O-acetylase OafA/YrhL